MRFIMNNVAILKENLQFFFTEDLAGEQESYQGDSLIQKNIESSFLIKEAAVKANPILAWKIILPGISLMILNQLGKN